MYTVKLCRMCLEAFHKVVINILSSLQLICVLWGWCHLMTSFFSKNIRKDFENILGKTTNQL